MLTQESTQYVPSWNREEQLHELTQIQRFNEMVTGRVRHIISSTKGDILVVALPNGITGYCAAKDFAIHQFKNTLKLVGKKADFVIKEILLDDQKVILSGKEAQERNIESFWTHIKTLEQAGALKDQTFTAQVTSHNDRTRKVHIRIHGQDAFIQERSEWSWSNYNDLNVDEGEEIEVKILRVDYENRRVEASRRLALPDPFVLLKNLQVGDPVAGRVARVDPMHGIFVTLEQGLDVKASKMKILEEPVVGDIVTCRLAKPVTREPNGRVVGRVVIIGYPNGKRKRKDFGSFLFE